MFQCQRGRMPGMYGSCLTVLSVCLLVSVLFCSDSREDPSGTTSSGATVSLTNPYALPDNTDSIQVILIYGSQAVIVFQGTPGDAGFEGPYETTLLDYAGEVPVLRIYAYDTNDSLLAVLTPRCVSTGGAIAVDTTSVHEIACAPGYTCYADPASDVVWVMKDDGNVNGPTCKNVCECASL